MVTNDVARAIGIEVDRGIVRGLMLQAGNPATVGGYAQVRLASPSSAAVVAVQVATSLDAEMAWPVVIVPTERAAEVHVAAALEHLRSAGFGPVTAEMPREAHERVAEPAEAEPALGCSIPKGLLASHEGLTLTVLAAVAGGALGLLPDQTAPDHTASEELIEPPVAEPEVAVVAVEAPSQGSVDETAATAEGEAEPVPDERRAEPPPERPASPPPSPSPPPQLSPPSPSPPPAPPSPPTPAQRVFAGLAAFVAIGLLTFAVMRCGTTEPSPNTPQGAKATQGVIAPYL